MNVGRTTHRSNADRIAISIGNAEAVVNGIERVYRVSSATHVDSNIKQLTTRNRPPLIFGIIDSALYTTVDGIGNRPRNLIVGEARVEYDNELTVGCFGDDGIIWDDLTVWTNDAIVFVSQSLPMLI